MKQYEKERENINKNKTYNQLMNEDSDYYFSIHPYKDTDLIRVIEIDNLYRLQLLNFLKNPIYREYMNK